LPKMGMSRDKEHKRRLTGGMRVPMRKKRKFLLARPAAMTKIGPKRIHPVRTRGGHVKQRALRLDSGNFNWVNEHVALKSRVVDVVYNSSNNELVRTKTLVKNAIIQIDATPFKQWYEKHYGVALGHKDKTGAADSVPAPLSGTATPSTMSGIIAAPTWKQSRHVKAIAAGRRADRVVDANLFEQFQTGRLYAAISSRPGQSGRVDGYILEGEELAFYQRKLIVKKKK